MAAEWIPAALNLASNLFGGGDDGPKTEVRGDELGLSHPGIDQVRLRHDPIYAEAAARANDEHIARFTIPFAAVDRTPISGVKAAVESQLSRLQAEGWRPPGAANVAPPGAANVAPHLPFTSTPGANSPKVVAPIDMNWILIGAAFFFVAIFLMKGRT